MDNILIYGLSSQWGGIESIVTNIAKILSKENDIDILISGDSIDSRYKSLNQCIHILPITAWGQNRKLFCEELIRVFQKKEYDYVWINGCLMSNMDIIKITRNYSKAKIISHSHGSNFESKNILKSLILKTLHYYNRKRYLLNVDYACMCSEVSGKWFYGKKFLKNNNVFLFKNGVDFDKFKYRPDVRSEFRNRYGIKNELVLLHVGRLTKVKNQIRLIEIVKEAVSIGMNLKLYIVGNGELEDELKRKTEELELTDIIHFPGSIHDVSPLYQMADIFLLPSFHEGLPVTLVEAQCAGLPCLVSDRITQEANISGMIEYLSIDSHNNSQWLNALQKYSTLPVDRKENAFQIIRNRYDLLSVAEDFKRFINL